MAGDAKFTEEILKDYGAIPFNEYKGESIRVRLVKSTMEGKAPGQPKLDVRIYVESDTYTGWTKKGFRLNREQAKSLSEMLAATLEG